MTTLWQSVLLGALQGATEFLPVSSSGHLALLLAFTGWEEARVVALIVCLHLATTLAVAVYFRREVAAVARFVLHPSGGPPEGRRLLLLVAAGSVPTAVIGLAFKDPLERLFSAPRFVAAGLAVTGLVLWAAESLAARRAARNAAPAPFTAGRAALVGLAQGVAIAPGISRSGATIGVALLAGLPPATAFSFSFLLSLPANLGAVALEARGLGSPPFGAILSLAAGMAAAFAVGYAALALLSRWVREGKLRIFSLYCWLLATISLLVFR